MIGTFYNEEFKAQRSSLIYLRLQAKDMGQRHDLRVFPDCKSHPLPTNTTDAFNLLGYKMALGLRRKNDNKTSPPI